MSNPLVYLSRKTWEYSRDNRPRVVLFVVMSFVANGLNLLEPLVVASILNIIQTEGATSANFPRLLMRLGLFLIITVLFWAFHGPSRVIERYNSFMVRATYKRFLLDGTMALPSEWHTNHHSGDTIDKIEKGTNALYEYSSNIFEVIQSIVLLAGSFIALALFSWVSGAIVLVMVVVTLAMILRFDRVILQQYKALYAAENRISERVYDVVGNITTVIILRIEKLVSSTIYKKIMEPFQLFRTNVQLNETKWFLVSFFSTLMTVLVLGSYLYTQITAGAVVLVGTVYALYGYVNKINNLFFRFAYLYNNKVQQRAAVFNAEEISKEFRQIAKSEARLLGSAWREIAIKDLRFSYHTEEGADLHLDGVSLTIHRGERIALIGESGSGKTTLLKIIRELYQPQHVEVRVDGESLPHGFQSISTNITLIPQDPEIFTTTILENITVGVSYPMETVRKFTDMARFTEVAERLPKGFDSSIVEKGVNLSGGEKQRLALARGLLACEDKAIVLLDEPTSSVDLGNELEIYQNIFHEFKDKTIISSIHRLHLLPQFEMIYMFSEGKIVASGGFDDLLASSQEFQNIWERYKKAKDGE